MAPLSRRITQEERVSVYKNRHGELFDDQTLGPRGDHGTYLRWRWANPCVIIVPTRSGLVGLWEMYRYPISAVSLEFPRGALSAGESAEDAATRELYEETGLVGSGVYRLGEIFPDSGFITTMSIVVRIEITMSVASVPTLEAMEAISREATWLRPIELWKHIAGGAVQCGLTIAAWALAVSRGELDGYEPTG
jgi:8-oxo-dGTP pyrophosphatase MutT (NUDIX family)